MLEAKIANRLMLVKYKMDDMLFIFEDGTTENVPSKNITSLNIEKDFDNDLCPILNVNMVIKREVYKKIVSNKNNLRVNMKLNKFQVKPTDDTLDNSFKFSEPAISGIFNVIMDDTDMDMYTRMQDKHFEDTVKPITDADGPDKINTELNIFLFTKEALDINKRLDNFIFCESDLTTAIVFFANACKINRLLMTPLDNSKIYNQIIIPEFKFTDIIRAMHSMYGLYNSSYVLFDDFNRLYLLSKKRDVNPVENNEIPLVYLYFGEFGAGLNRHIGGFIDNENNRYFINCLKQPEISELGPYIKEGMYNSIRAVNTTNHTNVTESTNIGGRNIDSIKVVDNKYDNDYIVNSNLYNINESNYSFVLEVDEMDFEMFTPNKKYNMYFDIKDYARATKYNGMYRLCKIVTNLIRAKSEEYLEAHSQCFFTSSI